MNRMEQLELQWGRAEAAWEAAADHAEREHANWKDQAYVLLLRFARGYRAPFICQQAREWAEQQGLPSAPTDRAWGSIMARASRAGLIRRVGFRYNSPTDKPNSHPAPVSEWQAA